MSIVIVSFYGNCNILTEVSHIGIIVVSLPKSHENIMMLSVPLEQDVCKLMEQLAIKMTHYDTIFFFFKYES